MNLSRIPMELLRNLIPADWRPSSAHYAVKDYADLPTVLVSLDAIDPPRRDPGIREFDLPRLRRLASGIVKGERIQPIEVGAPAKDNAYQYRVRNGFHRYYLCKELGFPMIPVVEIDD